MDEQVARTDVEKLRELLDRTTSKSKKQKEKADEYCSTFENLEQYPYIMRQSAWELEWEKVWALYDLECRILDAGPGFFFIKSFKEWWIELQKQSQGIGHSASSARHRLQTLERVYEVKFSSQYSMRTEYLVEVFKYPGTGNHIPTDAADGYGSTAMIGLYGLVEPYSIARITTTQSGMVGKDGK